MHNAGDFNTGSTVRIPWGTNAADGSSITRATDGSIRIYKDSSSTERTSSSGVTDTEDQDSITGTHLLTIDLSDNTDAGFYAAGHDYLVKLVGAVVDGKTVNAWIGSFSIENRNTQADLTKWNGNAVTTSVNGIPRVDAHYLGGTTLASASLTISSLTISNAATFTGGISIGAGIAITQSTTDGHGIVISGNGAGSAMRLVAGDTGQAMTLVAGSTSGDALGITTTSGHGINIVPTGNTKHGVKVIGGNGGNSDGINLTAGAGGVSFRASTITISGTTSLAALSTSGTLTLNAFTCSNTFLVGGQILLATGGGQTKFYGGVSIVGGLINDGATTLTGAASAANASNDIRGVRANDANNAALATAAKLLKYCQLLARKDAAIATDNAIELTELNANGGSGAGEFDNTTDSEQALADGIAAGGGDDAETIWSHGQRTLTGGPLIAVNQQQSTAKTIVRGNSYSATARSLLITIADGAEWPTDLSEWTWAFTAEKHPDNEESGAASVTGTVTVVNATGDSRAVRVDLTTEDTASMAIGLYNTSIRGTKAGEKSSINVAPWFVVDDPQEA